MTSPINNASTVSTKAFHVIQYQLCGFFSALSDFRFSLRLSPKIQLLGQPGLEMIGFGNWILA